MSQTNLDYTEDIQDVFQVTEKFDFRTAILIRKSIFLILVSLNLILIYSAYTKIVTPNYLESHTHSPVPVGDVAIVDDIIDIDPHGESENILLLTLERIASQIFVAIEKNTLKFKLFISENLSRGLFASNKSNPEELTKRNEIEQILTLAEFYQELIRDSKPTPKLKGKTKSKPWKTNESKIEITNSTPFGPPVVGPITSNFGKRSSPFTGRVSFHSGIDISIKRGTPVVASADGIVKFSGRKGGYGKLVHIEHANGKETLYAHLSKVDVLPGRMIKRGQQIGAVGSTGQSTGPHLHYEIRKDGVPIDPRPFLDVEMKLARK